ncbi:unnamed protein product [Lactuca saligna]|uniref:Uncharacterized protein n=1 Tax=Lactuca saligna TaxID=75948 RepID=A0AA35ZQB0_LACSI|nr:unnamed protein product [Lactuca saligna]
MSVFGFHHRVRFLFPSLPNINQERERFRFSCDLAPAHTLLLCKVHISESSKLKPLGIIVSLDLSANREKQSLSQNDAQKIEGLLIEFVPYLCQAIVKALADCMIDAKENLDISKSYQSYGSRFLGLKLQIRICVTNLMRIAVEATLLIINLSLKLKRVLRSINSSDYEMTESGRNNKRIGASPSPRLHE